MDTTGGHTVTKHGSVKVGRKFPDHDDSPFVFQSERRKNQAINRLRHINYAIAKSGINDDPFLVEKKGKFPIHLLRVSFASTLAQSGNHSINEIRELFGHTSTTMTEEYAHLLPSEVTRTATSIFNAVSKTHS